MACVEETIKGADESNSEENRCDWENRTEDAKLGYCKFKLHGMSKSSGRLGDREGTGSGQGQGQGALWHVPCSQEVPTLVFFEDCWCAFFTGGGR